MQRGLGASRGVVKEGGRARQAKIENFRGVDFVRQETLEQVRTTINFPVLVKYISCGRGCGKAYSIYKAIEDEFRKMHVASKRPSFLVISLNAWPSVPQRADLPKLNHNTKRAIISQDSVLAIKHNEQVYIASCANQVVVRPSMSAEFCFVMRATELQVKSCSSSLVSMLERKLVCSLGPESVAACVESKWPLEFTDKALELYNDKKVFTFREAGYPIGQGVVTEETRIVCTDDVVQPFYFVPQQLVGLTHALGVVFELLGNYSYNALLPLEDLRVFQTSLHTKLAWITPLALRLGKTSTTVKATMFQVELDDQASLDVFSAVGFPGTTPPKTFNLLQDLINLKKVSLQDES